VTVSIQDEAGTGPVLSPPEAKTLLAACRRIYPHDTLGDGPYEGWVAKLDGDAASDPALASRLHEGVRTLDAAGKGAFAELSPDKQLDAIRQIDGTDFFNDVRSTGVVALYDNPEVWAHLGWEGASYDRGGYLHRGFDDLDWLPDAHDGSI